MNKKILVLLPALALLLAGCGGNSSNPTTKPVDSGSAGISDTSASESGVTGVEVDHETLELQVGQTAKLSASVKPISLDDREVEWSSDNAEVASVDASGMVTAVATGTAKIKAAAHADPTKFAECTVTVTGRKVTVALTTPAEIMASTEELKFGANQKNVNSYYFFTGTVDGSTRGETSVSWADGVAVKLEAASAAGKYLVSFTKDGAKKYFEMDDVHHYAIVENPTAGREWEWNETYATVQRTISGQSTDSNNGTFLPGTYNQYTTISGCNVNQAANDFFFQFVYQADPVAPTAITVKAADTKIYQGGTLQMEAELAPAAAEGKVVWSVTGDEKVTIDKDGLLSAAADATLGGKVTVKAAYEKDASIFGTKEITVAEKINYGTKENPLTVAEAKAVLDKTGTSESEQPLFVKGIISTNKAFSSQYHNGEVWLQSDDGSVAKAFELYRCEIDASLNYSGDPDADDLVGYEVIATGYGKIYGTTYELTNVTRNDVAINPKLVSMTREEVAATAVALDKTTAEVEVGSTVDLKATLTPANSTAKVSWKSSDETKATVAKGKVTGVAAGNVTITAFVDADGNGEVGATELKAECAVTVKVAAATEAVVADFSTKAVGHSSYSDTWVYGDFTISGGANNNKGWAFIKMGGKSATISAEGYPGTYIKTDKAISYSVTSITIKFVGKCYNQADEKATVKVLSYSDAALATKVAETPAQEVPAISTNDGVETVTFTFATAQAANLYYKINFDIVNTTTYNGVVALEKVTFNAA